MRSFKRSIKVICLRINKSFLTHFDFKIYFIFIFILFFLNNQSKAQNYYPANVESLSNTKLNEISITSIKQSLSHDSFNYKDYFLIKEDPRLQVTNLLFFNHINEVFPKPAVPYNRNKHFGSWIIPDSNQSCLSTRGYVLKRDSLDEVNYAPSGCAVKQGNWLDPYSAIQFTTSDKIQIDHFVPLKNAYMTGAHEWNWAKRCLYGNYMGNTFHLLAVSGTENMKKSDETPSQYLPPNSKYICTYIKQWLAVKLIWSLKLTPIEVSAIQNEVAENRCNPELFMIPTQFISDQRQYIQDHQSLCHGASTAMDIYDHFDDSEF